MICAIMQPTYIPWMGYFDLIDKVDKFVFYDNVQLAKRSWQVRNRLKGSNGELWLTIPITKTKSRNETLILNAVPNINEKWIKNHLRSIELNYKKAKSFESVFELLRNEYVEQVSLADFNINLIKTISRKIGIKTDFIRSSEIEGIIGQKDDRLVQICQALKINKYLSPQGSADYINETTKGGLFVSKEIDLFYHDYKHPEYQQLFKKFMPYTGIYDLLFNVGFDNALQIIRSGRKNNIHFTNL